MSLQYLTLREWRNRFNRTLLTLLSVAVGVSAIVGTSLARQTVRNSLGRAQEAVAGPPAVDIVSAEGGRFSPALVPELTNIAGVQQSVPMLTRGAAARLKGQRFRTLLTGFPMPESPDAIGLELASGQLPKNPNEAILGSDIAQLCQAELGSKVVLLTPRGPRTATVVGIATPASLDRLVQGSRLIMPLVTAQSWNRLDDQVDRVRVFLNDRDQQVSVSAAIAPRLPAELSAQTPQHPMQLADDILRSTELAMSFAGVLAMAMSAFIILNTLRMNFAERRRQLAIMRAIGATSGQITTLLLREGALLGLIGAVLGIPGGIVLAWSLSKAMEQIVDTSIPSVEISVWELLFALVAGVVMSTIAAFIPAWQSRHVSPVEGMRDPEMQREERFPWLATVLAFCAWLVAAILLALVVSEIVPPEVAIGAGLLMLVSFIALLPALQGPVVRVMSLPFSKAWQVQATLARQQLLRRPLRTGLTAGVLVVAMSNALGLGNAIQSNVGDVRLWHRKAMAGDFFLARGPADQQQLADGETLASELTKLDNVAEVVSLRFRPARIAGKPAVCIVRDFAADSELPWAVTEQESPALRAAIAAGKLIISSTLARHFQLQVDDSLTIDVDGRRQPLVVGGIVSDYNLGGNAVYLDLAAAQARWELPQVDLFQIQLKDPAEKAQTAAALAVFAKEHELLLTDFDQQKRELDSIIDGIVGALWSLTLLGFVIGGVAVANTLTMSVLDRTRELGLLRIVGMTRSQVMTLVLVEAILIGLLGVIMGIAAGLTTAWIIHLCNEPLVGRAVTFVFDPRLLALGILGCLVTSLVAATSAARRAAKTNILSAIAYE